MELLKDAANHFNNLPEEQKKMLKELTTREITKMFMENFFPELEQMLLLLFEEEEKWIRYEVGNKITKEKKLKLIEKEAKKVERILNQPAFKGAMVPYLEMNIFDVLKEVSSKMEKLKPILPQEESPFDEFQLLFPEILKTIDENGSFNTANQSLIYPKLREFLITNGYNKNLVEINSNEQNPFALLTIPLVFADLFTKQLNFLKEFYYEIDKTIDVKTKIKGRDMHSVEYLGTPSQNDSLGKQVDQNRGLDNTDPLNVLITVREYAQDAVVKDLKDYIKKESQERFKLLIKGRGINEPIIFLGNGSVLTYAIQELKNKKIIIDDTPKVVEWLFQNFNYEYGNPASIKKLRKTTIEAYFVNGRKPKKNSQIELNEVLKLKTV